MDGVLTTVRHLLSNHDPAQNMIKELLKSTTEFKRLKDLTTGQTFQATSSLGHVTDK